MKIRTLKQLRDFILDGGDFEQWRLACEYLKQKKGAALQQAVDEAIVSREILGADSLDDYGVVSITHWMEFLQEYMYLELEDNPEDDDSNPYPERTDELCELLDVGTIHDVDRYYVPDEHFQLLLIARAEVQRRVFGTELEDMVKKIPLDQLTTC